MQGSRLSDTICLVISNQSLTFILRYGISPSHCGGLCAMHVHVYPNQLFKLMYLIKGIQSKVVFH